MALTGPDLPKVPAPLKPIQPYLTVASKYDQRDLIVSYWCRLYALHVGLQLSTKTAEETNLLRKITDWLEVAKKHLQDNNGDEFNDIAVQAHLENWALKLFSYADKNDRAANFSKTVVQSFYTAHVLYDVLKFFGDLSEEAAQNQKYAQWKAAYIHNCLANGETPVPGPMKEADDDSNPVTESNDNDEEPGSNINLEASKNESSQDLPSVPINLPSMRTQSIDSEEDTYKTESGVKLTVEQIGKAQKLIKWASSALDYDDIATSVMNLRKVLHLLTTGQEPA